MRTVSLRARVVVAVLILMAAVLVLLGFVVTTLLGNALREDLRQRLADRAGYAVVLQQQGVTGQMLADQMSGSGVFSSFSSDGAQYVGRDPGPPEPGSPAGPAAGRPQGAPPTLPQPAVEPEVSFSETGGLLVAQVTLPDGSLQLQASEAEIERTLSVLRTIEVVAGAVALLVTGLVLTRVVSLALRPLDRMTALAHRIRAGARGRRLRPTKPQTEIGRTATAFDEMLDSLEAAETAAQLAQEQMRQFLADASHDLRTPLAGVIAGSDALLRSDFDQLDRADREQRLVAIVRQARQAARLVDDLLVMARLDNPARGLGPVPDGGTVSVVDLVELTSQQLDAVALRRPDVRPRLSGAAGPLPVRIDPDDLRRALSNLLENAATVSPPGGEISVEICTADGGVRVAVIDDGPGIPDGERERIFERFVRLSTDRSGSGSGLGLPIARAIARRAGGEVECRPRADRGVGARFELSLPCGAA